MSCSSASWSEQYLKVNKNETLALRYLHMTVPGHWRRGLSRDKAELPEIFSPDFSAAVWMHLPILTHAKLSTFTSLVTGIMRLRPSLHTFRLFSVGGSKFVLLFIYIYKPSDTWKDR